MWLHWSTNTCSTNLPLRCRTLYEKYLLHNPANCAAWCKFAELEASLNEAERARALYELAIQQPVLDMPELLWKAYIDFEIAQGEREYARALYERLLERTKHVKVLVLSIPPFCLCPWCWSPRCCCRFG